jgi:MFS family permease
MKATWLLCAAGTVSALGDGMTIVAMPLLATSITEDPRGVSAVRLAALLPWLALSLPAGLISDRVSRRQVLITANLVRVAVLLIVAVLAERSPVSLWPLYLLVFALGGAQSLFDSASQAFLPEITGEDELQQANGLLFTGQAAGTALVGPPLGGLLFSRQPAAPFLVDAASFVIASALLLAIRPTRRSGSPPETGLRQQMWQAVRYIVDRPIMRTFAILVTAVNLAHGMASAIIVLWATKLLGLSVGGYGLLIGLGSAGGLVGGLIANRTANAIGTWRTLRASIVLATAATVAFGLAWTSWQAYAIAIVDGMAVMTWGVVAVSVRQRLTPAELLGRTTGIYRTLGVGSMATGAAVSGYLAHLTSLRVPFLIGGAIAAVAVMAHLPNLAPRPHPVASPSRLDIDDG